MYEVLVAKTTGNFGLAATRSVYEKAIESLPDSQTAEMCLRFAGLERKLGEIDRARAIYAHGSQFCDPRSEWNSFEVETGSEDTFREHLRIKRAVQASVSKREHKNKTESSEQFTEYFLMMMSTIVQY